MFCQPSFFCPFLFDTHWYFLHNCDSYELLKFLSLQKMQYLDLISLQTMSVASCTEWNLLCLNFYRKHNEFFSWCIYREGMDSCMNYLFYTKVWLKFCYSTPHFLRTGFFDNKAINSILLAREVTLTRRYGTSQLTMPVWQSLTKLLRRRVNAPMQPHWLMENLRKN